MSLALILGSIHYGQVHPSHVYHLYLHLPALQGVDGQNKHRLAPCKGGRCKQLHLYLHLPAFQEVFLTMTRLAKPEGLKEARRRLKGSLPVKGWLTLVASSQLVFKSLSFTSEDYHSTIQKVSGLNYMHLKLTKNFLGQQKTTFCPKM